MSGSKNQKTAIPESQWKWYGKAGHCIIGHWCRFHMLTHVGNWLISTIGEYVHPRNSKGTEKDDYKWWEDNYPGEDLGSGFQYETFVFKAGNPCREEGCNCGQPTLSDTSEVDVIGANNAKEATAAHMTLCKKYKHSAIRT